MSSLILWTCQVPGCTVGNVIPDQQGLSGHQAATGHAAVLGEPVGWIFNRDAAAA